MPKLRPASVSPLRRIVPQNVDKPLPEAPHRSGSGLAWLFDAAPFGIMTAAGDGRLIAINSEARRQFERAAPGVPVAELFAPEHRDVVGNLLEHGRGGRLRVCAADGGVEVELHAIVEGSLVAIYTTDLTESYQTGALLDVLFDSAPTGLGFWDRELRFQRVNRVLADINGVPPEEHIGRTVKEVLPDMDARVMQALRHVVEAGSPLIDQEASGYTPSQPGVLRQWSVSYYPVRLGGQVVGAGAVWEEVTRLRRAEIEIARAMECERFARAEAQAAEKRAAFLARAATVLASSLNYEATVANVARLAVPDVADWAAVDMVGADGELKRLAIAHTDNHKVELAVELHRRYSKHNRPLRRVIETGQPEIVEHVPAGLLEAVAVDEEHLRMLRMLDLRSYLIVPIRGGSRNVLGAITLVTAESGRHFGTADLRLADEVADRVSVAIQNAVLFAEAEKRRAEAEAAAESLRRANSDLEQFAYLTSHDLQEPLRSVTSFAQLLERRHNDELSPEARGYLGHIVEGARRMSHLIHDLLEYSEVSRDEGPQLSPVDMERVLAHCERSLEPAIAEPGASITHDPLPVLRRANQAQMQQVLMNLLTNSLKYANPDEPPKIHVSARRADEGWIFSVRDNGQGFDPKYHERIFGVFKRLHGREVPGTGIGLALCQRIVERHRGWIRAESAPGQGATFHFMIAD